jgi:hypothetical protein
VAFDASKAMPAHDNSFPQLLPFLADGIIRRIYVISKASAVVIQSGTWLLSSRSKSRTSCYDSGVLIRVLGDALLSTILYVAEIYHSQEIRGDDHPEGVRMYHELLSVQRR